jgi:hypothetical protein
VQIGSLPPIFQDNFHTTKLFKKQNIGVAYKTKNNIGRILNRNKKQMIEVPHQWCIPTLMPRLPLYIYWTNGHTIPD